MVGGSETTATTLSGATYLLVTNRPVLDKIYAELKASFTHQDEINLISVQKLDYMLAALKECLRMYPAVASAIPRVSPPGGSTVRGEWIPGNASSHLATA